MEESFESVRDYIFNIPKFAAKHSMQETVGFLRVIGDFSEKYPTIHIAGTNGKGSVCAYLRSVFKKAGKKAAVFTSPHLVSVCERFEFDGRYISEDEFTECFLTVRKYLEYKEFKDKEYHPSYFEYLFFMFAVWVKKICPDVIILETGLGGRLDATNSISCPKVCVITEIGLDHMEYLGDTVEKIAGEKAGIIKDGASVVFVDKPLSGPVIENRAKGLGCDYYRVDENSVYNVTRNSKGIDFSLKSLYYGNATFSVKSFALYQAENGALSFYTLEALQKQGIFSFSQGLIKEGFSEMEWPGRMEEILPNVFLDGAHNVDGVSAFIASVACDGFEHRRLLYSAVSDKQIEDIARIILESGLFDDIILTHLSGERAASPERLMECFKSTDCQVRFLEDVEEAFDTLVSTADENCRGYVAGSLYLVGRIKELL